MASIIYLQPYCGMSSGYQAQRSGGIADPKTEYDLFIVTNQSGVARGYYTEEDVQLLHEWMSATGRGRWKDYSSLLLSISGRCLSRNIIKSSWRKPAPGMILQAARDYPVDLSRSFMIGDGVRDIECAHAAGIDDYLFQGDGLTILSERF